MLPGPGPADPDQFYRELHGQLRAGQFELVRDRIKSAYPHAPRDARFEQLLGLAHRGLLDSADAHAAFARAAQQLPQDPLIAHSVARAALEAGWSSTALFDQARLLAPSDGAVAIGRAAAQLAEGRGAAALTELGALLERTPEWIEGHRTYAQIAAIIDPGGDSCASLRSALTHEPRQAALWFTLIQQRLGAYRYDLALEAIAEARAALGPGEALTRMEAVALGEAGEAEAALALLAPLALPEDGDGTIPILRNLIRSGRYRDAQALAERNYIEPDLPAIWPYRALLWRLTCDARWDRLEGDERLVRTYDLPLDTESLEHLGSCLRGLHQGSGAPLDQSVRGGTQTDGNLFARAEPEIRALRRMIDEALAEHVAQLPPIDPAHPTLGVPRGAIRYAGAWSVRLRGAGYHHDHVHTHGWLSSALYVDLPDSLGDSDEAGWLTLGENRRLLPEFAAFRTVEPVRGRLVIFPSTMWHGTRPFGSGERLTVAFDVARPMA